MTGPGGRGGRAGRALAAACLLAAVLQASAVAAEVQEPDCVTRPAWCPNGYVCQPTACAAEAAAQLRILTAELDAARARRWRRFHFDLTCGIGVASVLLSETDAAGRYAGSDLDWFPTPGGCLAGVAFRLGR